MSSSKQQDSNGMQALDLPMSAPEMSLGLALSKRLKFWGYRRTLDTYRAAVNSGVELTQALGTLYEAKRELEQERERWANIDTYREGAAKEADIFLREVEARRRAAEENEIEGHISLQKAKERLAALEVLQKIEENDRAAELANSESRRVEAERRAEEARSGEEGSSYRERRRELERRRKDYEMMMADKEADIETYGGEDKLPHWLQTLYDQAEDEFGFGER